MVTLWFWHSSQEAGAVMEDVEREEEIGKDVIIIHARNVIKITAQIAFQKLRKQL